MKTSIWQGENQTKKKKQIPHILLLKKMKKKPDDERHRQNWIGIIHKTHIMLKKKH